MKKITLCFILLLLSTNICAGQGSASKLLTFKGAGKAELISRDVSMGAMNYAFNSITAVDADGNFYFCSSDGNAQGNVWKIMKMHKSSGQVSEMCRLNLKNNKYRYIRAINYTPNESLYAWIALEGGGKEAALVEISGF
ncbi:hypothetical protein ACFL38_01530 [Candidatus Omnitrophota bacterium]